MQYTCPVCKTKWEKFEDGEPAEGDLVLCIDCGVIVKVADTRSLRIAGKDDLLAYKEKDFETYARLMLASLHRNVLHQQRKTK